MRLDGLYCPLWPVVVPRELKSAVDTSLSSRHSPAPTPAETKGDGRSFTVAVGALQRWQHKCRAKTSDCRSASHRVWNNNGLGEGNG